MPEINGEHLIEEKNLEETLEFLLSELNRDSGLLGKQRRDMIDMNRYMFKELSVERQAELNFMLDEYLNTAATSDATAKQIKKYRKMIKSPYFGRFDFCEEGFSDTEVIYLGYYNLMKQDASRVYVYDWRSPIASLYYRYEPGACSFDAPSGKISGEMTKKRQIKIEDSRLRYFFDSNIVIRDEMLMEILSGNTRDKLKTIVETIQKEQDAAIRDLNSRVLIVQGAAGSGKTSIAVHRIGYLLYETKRTGATRENMLILSPNTVFSSYIEAALPELGEEPVGTLTFFDIVGKVCRFTVMDRGRYMESLARRGEGERRLRVRSAEFRLSEEYARVLEQFALVCERKLIKFSDIYLDGKLIITADDIKQNFLDKKSGLPAAKRLSRIELKIKELAVPVFNEIKQKLTERVYDNGKNAFDEERRIEMLLQKKRNDFYGKLNSMLTVQPLSLLMELYNSPHLMKPAKLPEDFSDMAKLSLKACRRGYLLYEDGAALLYLTILLCGNGICPEFPLMRQIVIDEAQDYEPLHYIIIKKLFQNARFTILGDVNQSLDRAKDGDFYSRVSAVFGGAGRSPDGSLLAHASVDVSMRTITKSYRSTAEIIEFTNKLLGWEAASATCRSGRTPEVVKTSENILITELGERIESARNNGYKMIGVIALNRGRAEQIYKLLTFSDKNLLVYEGECKPDSISVMPFYTAKGLEFDAVFVIADEMENMENDGFYKRAMYVACTRALHLLTVFDNTSC